MHTDSTQVDLLEKKTELFLDKKDEIALQCLEIFNLHSRQVSPEQPPRGNVGCPDLGSSDFLKNRMPIQITLLKSITVYKT